MVFDTRRLHMICRQHTLLHHGGIRLGLCRHDEPQGATRPSPWLPAGRLLDHPRVRGRAQKRQRRHQTRYRTWQFPPLADKLALSWAVLCSLQVEFAQRWCACGSCRPMQLPAAVPALFGSACVSGHNISVRQQQSILDFCAKSRITPAGGTSTISR
jgi:hypothetical protein